jgi:hypothetical protein
MTQALYAHMNNKRKKKKKRNTILRLKLTVVSQYALRVYSAFLEAKDRNKDYDMGTGKR